MTSGPGILSLQWLHEVLEQDSTRCPWKQRRSLAYPSLRNKRNVASVLPVVTVGLHSAFCARSQNPPYPAWPPEMKCACSNCMNPEISVAKPCSVCQRLVHHLCANELCRYNEYERENISVRLCSAECIDTWKETASVPSTPAWSAATDGSMIGLLLAARQENELDFSQDSTTDASQSSSLSASSNILDVDEYGIPKEISHFRPARKRDDVWSVAHVLDKPYAITNDDDADVFTHVCLLCAKKKTSRPNARSDAWEEALKRFGHTSNVKDHLVAIHPDHPLGKAEIAKRAQRAKRQLDTAILHANEQARAIENGAKEDAPPKLRGSLPRLWGPTQKQVNIFLSQWLIHDGLPHNMVTTDAFKLMLKRVTVNPKTSVLAPATYRVQLDVAFDDFRRMTKTLLLKEFAIAHHSPFRNLHHDCWTTRSGKTGVVGVSVCFIDKSWCFRTIALLATVANESHTSIRLKTLISSRIRDLYDVDIDAMAQFTVSDTTPTARKVSRLFEDSVQTDCSMHQINLCLVYGMGMRENIQTVEVEDEETGIKKKLRRVCTEGGAFPEGAALIRKVRAINNYFNTPQRVARFTKIQRQFGLPELESIVHCDTRVGSTVALFARSIVNYTALKCYFEQCEADDDPAVFDKMSGEDWRLVAEMEAVVGTMANLACADVQRADIPASELIVLIKIANDQLNTNSFDVYTLDTPRTAKTKVSSFPRQRVPYVALSAGARTCVARLKAQVQKRVSKPTAETVVILLLDPRTKFSVETIIRNSSAGAVADVDSSEKDAAARKKASKEYEQELRRVIDAGNTLLRNAHREVFAAMHSNGASVTTQASALPNLDVVPCVDGEMVLCGAQLPTVMFGSTSAATLHEQADEVLQQWLSFGVNWVDVARAQSKDETMTEDAFTKLLLVRCKGVVQDRLDALFRHVDICRWFRETGETAFPSIAALARVWLGRSPSNACQERVFSTGGIVMGPLRGKTDNERGEKQVLLKYNKSEIQRMG